MSPEEITTAASLLEALDLRPRAPAEARAFDEAIWAARGTEGAMLVTDLSGFTRLTKKHGILHFLAMFRRCQRVCLPLIAEHGGTLLKEEADDFIVLFPDVPRALDAALAMLRAMSAVNADLPEDERVYMCIGIDHGRFLRLTDDAFGDTVNVAFKLGEDIAERNEILLGEPAFARLAAAGYDLSGCLVTGPKAATTGNIQLLHHSIRPEGLVGG